MIGFFFCLLHYFVASVSCGIMTQTVWKPYCFCYLHRGGLFKVAIDALFFVDSKEDTVGVDTSVCLHPKKICWVELKLFSFFLINSSLFWNALLCICCQLRHRTPFCGMKKAHTYSSSSFYPPRQPLSGKWAWVGCDRRRRALFCWPCAPATWS